MKTIFLIGGYLINNNYGDVIQAKVWVDFYKSKCIDFILVYYKEGKGALSLSFPNERLIDYDEFIKKINGGRQDMVIHMYGGGYMNKNFGDIFNQVLIEASKNSIETLVTGVQADKWFAEQFRKLNNKFKKEKLSWISFRDSKSKFLLGSQDSIICDDSFGYFEKRFINKKIYQASNIKRNKILLQLSLNSYMYKNKSNSQLKENLRDLILSMSDNYSVDLISSFKDTPGVLEGKILLEQLGINLKNKITTTQSIDDSLISFKGYKIAIINSFHTYILATFKLGCPVYFISMSDYYDQKAQALMEYGLLDNEHIIRDLERLKSMVKPKLEKMNDNNLTFDKMFKRFDGVRNILISKINNK